MELSPLLLGKVLEAQSLVVPFTRVTDFVMFTWPGGQIKTSYRDANGNIVRFETASVVNEATGLVQFSSLGQATFANNQLTFGDGSVWAKGVSLNPASATPAPSGKSKTYFL